MKTTKQQKSKCSNILNKHKIHDKKMEEDLVENIRKLKKVDFDLNKFYQNMMDEQLIDEVAQHAVIYNRQKYYLNGSVNGQGAMAAANKYETKDEAWQNIAMKLRSDVETCKKRWKYLRERYVSQRKQGDPPVYEHLSRPYLEKMKFLDQHIQPRKSYRNVPNFLTSPHSANGSNYNDYNMDSKSNSSLKSMGHFGGQHHPFQDQQHAMNALSTAAVAASALEGDSRVKLEADQVFRDFAAAVASQQLQQISQTQMNHHQAAAAAAAAVIATDPQNYNEHFRDAASSALSAVVAGSQHGNGNGMHSTSSPSIKSPLSSPMGATQNGGSTSAGHSSTPMHQPAASTVVTNHSITSLTNDQVGGGDEANSGNSGHVNNNHFHNHNNFNDCQQEDMDSTNTANYTKKPRVQLMNCTTTTTTTTTDAHNSQPANNLSNGTVHNNQLTNGHHHHQTYTKMDTSNNSQYGGEETDDDSDENSGTIMPSSQPSLLNGEHHHSADNPFNNIPAASPAPSNASSSNALQRSSSTTANGAQTPMFPSNADFLFQLYQQFPQQQSQLQQQQQQQQFGKFQSPNTPMQRCSEHLLGELVTTELLKMTKERRKVAQKRILEILFFDD